MFHQLQVESSSSTLEKQHYKTALIHACLQDSRASSFHGQGENITSRLQTAEETVIKIKLKKVNIALIL